MADHEFHEVEWKIENFSCWSDAVNEKFIESSNLFLMPFKAAQLFPRGGSARDDHMEVRFCKVEKKFECELSFIDFEGSVIQSQQVKSTLEGETGDTFLGPKFDEVIRNIKRAGRKDEITLRFRLRVENNFKQLMYSTLNVLKVSLKIDPQEIIEVDPRESVNLFFIDFCTNDDKIIGSLGVQNENILLDLKLFKPDQKPVLVESCITLVKSNGDIVKCEENRHVYTAEEKWTFWESLKKKELEENGLSILLHIKLNTGEVSKTYYHFNYGKEVSVLKNNPSFSEPKSRASPVPYSDHPDDSVTELTKELMGLYQDHDYSDLELRCDNVSFPVHRNILSARSPVFKSMLSLQEAGTGCMDIADMTPCTLALFLAFLYAGSVEGMQDESALNLYYAADKYQVPSLKKKCADFLSVNVSLSNVCDILTLADKHKDENLIAVSHNFILDNNSAVMVSNEWGRFMESEPKLALKTFTYFAQKKYVVKNS